LLVEGEGFEPSKAEPTDLQSVPFDRSGTPPAKQQILRVFTRKVKQLYIPGKKIALIFINACQPKVDAPGFGHGVESPFHSESRKK
jgi:hypothetical protein